ncbi:hypothetical protein F4776DRAFT_663930 [Hypoxylon sp. NC0597]|nr:hypothetical protein F4776DRAFT_663930 [Hypoxylon sp. NC0597]
MSGTNPLPAPKTAVPSRGQQPISSHSNSRNTTAEDPYGDRLPGTSSISRSVENLFATFDGEFVATSTPPSASSPESYQVSPLDSESDPDDQEAASNLNGNGRPAQIREQFGSDSNEPAGTQAIYGEEGKYQANAEAIADDEDVDDELVVVRQVARRRLAFTHQPSQHSQGTATEQVGVVSTVDDENDLDSFSMNNFLPSEWLSTNSPRTRNGVREQGPEEWEMVPRSDEVKSSSRKYEPGPTYEKAKKSERFWGIQDKIWDWKDLEPRCRKYISENWQKVKNLFKREAPGDSQVYELKDWPRNPFRVKGKGKAHERKPAAVLPQHTETTEIERRLKPETGYGRRRTVLGEPENGSPSTSSAVPRYPQRYGEDEVIAECSNARNGSNLTPGQDFDPMLSSPIAQLKKSSRWGGWFSEIL